MGKNIDTTGLDQLEEMLNGLEDDIQSIEDNLGKFSKDVLNKIMMRCPIKSGRLRQSIKALKDQSGMITISMLDYGAFVNYGVSGRSDNKGKPVPKNFGLPAPSSGNNYKFKKRKYGIQAHEFFDVDEITEQFINTTAKIVKEIK